MRHISQMNLVNNNQKQNYWNNYYMWNDLFYLKNSIVSGNAGA